MSDAGTPRPASITPDRSRELYYAAELLDVLIGQYDADDLIRVANYLTADR